MPKLTYRDVFSSDKAQIVETIEELERDTKAFGFALAYLMLRSNIKEVTVPRDELEKMLSEAGLPESFRFGFAGDNKSLTVSLSD